ncbi:MAG TPA: amidase family protein, partial [Steroidobacteraceae bacterium]|nr:amidase family protein [Steroidobacteraceae bacterium]
MTRSARHSEAPPLTVIGARAALAAGTSSAVELARTALARADSAAAAAVFIGLRREPAMEEARESDALRRAGSAHGVLAGIPVSVKDLFDVAGEVTAAGSAVLAQGTPAARDAAAIERLRGAGAIILGRTNMTELAFSGLGLNPHFGTPRNPAAAGEARI